MTRKIKRGGKVWINIFPDKPITTKPAETRMGSGKGNPEGWVAVVKPGRVMFELAGVPEDLAKDAMRLAGHKLPIRTKFVRREGAEAVVKASEAHNLKDDELLQRSRTRAGGAVRAAPPARHRRAREHLAAGRRPARRRAAADRRQGARNRPRTRAEGLMADEEKNDEAREQEEAAEEKAPEAEAPAEEAPKDEAPEGGGSGRGRPG